MKNLAKKTTALTCAMLMTVGGFSQASAANAEYYLDGVKMTGTATRTVTTTVVATTSITGQATNASMYTIRVRAYAKADGKTQYGTQKSANITTNGSVNNKLDNSIYIITGIGTTGFGGEHSLDIYYKNGSGTTFRTTGTRTSSY